MVFQGKVCLNYYFKKISEGHEFIKLPIKKDPRKYLKCKIYFTFSCRFYNVNKNIKKLKVSGVIIATTVQIAGFK